MDQPDHWLSLVKITFCDRPSLNRQPTLCVRSMYTAEPLSTTMASACSKGAETISIRAANHEIIHSTVRNNAAVADRRPIAPTMENFMRRGDGQLPSAVAETLSTT